MQRRRRLRRQQERMGMQRQREGGQGRAVPRWGSVRVCLRRCQCRCACSRVVHVSQFMMSGLYGLTWFDLVFLSVEVLPCLIRGFLSVTSVSDMVSSVECRLVPCLIVLSSIERRVSCLA